MTFSSKSKKVKEALQAFDWFYSEEGKELLSWGKVTKCIRLRMGKEITP